MQGTTGYEPVAQSTAGDSDVLMTSPSTRSEISRRVQVDLDSFARGDSSGTVQGDLDVTVPGDRNRHTLQPLHCSHGGVASGGGLPVPQLSNFGAAPLSFQPLASGDPGSQDLALSAFIVNMPQDAETARVISSLQLECDGLRVTARAALQYQQDQFKLAAVEIESRARELSVSEVHQEESAMHETIRFHLAIIRRAVDEHSAQERDVLIAEARGAILDERRNIEQRAESVIQPTMQNQENAFALMQNEAVQLRHIASWEVAQQQHSSAAAKSMQLQLNHENHAVVSLQHELNRLQSGAL